MGAFGELMDDMDLILDKLSEVDIICGERGVNAEILILGGAGLLLLLETHNRKFRPTRDIDINLLSTNDEEGIRKVLKELAIDVLDGVVEVPPIEDFREQEKFRIEDAGFEHIKVFVPMIELLACTKIFSKREKDLQDLQDTDLLDICNKEKLLAMVNEYKDYLINPNDPDLNYHQLLRILKQKGL
ncbi:DUF6036 family nucleotidyltransferase [Lysinibacillus piscis]|uniref:DUF6036 domain-containing protein n=1 Tax=Lysinibacillus piscis TaxID=2518931 RepID=A0ABQ5NPT1_9BACI|nr:DUF6036 family nucleotidyltransferase [Lysinibacillus sp. KH24]GLC90345.1 hypothetical protein LYSBPC_34720 [Lysinibacillus sp. KH24]